LEIEAFPATDLDHEKPPDAPAVLLNREFGNTASKLFLYKITWSGKKASTSRVQTWSRSSAAGFAPDRR
jgi:hypothetical protein